MAVRAVGLTHGPVHAEMRVNEDGVWILEVAARSIGGLCSQCLRFEECMSLEELIIRHALGDDIREIRREESATGVMMIPIPQNGIYLGVRGLEYASAVAGIDSVIITATYGQQLKKLPEGASYLGFILARSACAEDVESALRNAHARLDFDLAAELEVMRFR
jgi:hypothetical protein